MSISFGRCRDKLLLMISRGACRFNGKSTCLSLVFVAFELFGGEQPQFEAASVKRADRCTMQNSLDAGMISLLGDPLTVVLAEAYGVKMDQITGPSWLEGDCFSIVAKMPEGATKEQRPAMLRALLIERFKLVAHKDTRSSSGYALLVDKNGPKLKATAPDSPSAGRVAFSSSSIKGSMSIASLVRSLSHELKLPVEDLTGLKGRYDIDVSWVPEGAATDPPGADIFMAFRDSLGLKIESRKGTIDTLIIDHIERVPTEN